MVLINLLNIYTCSNLDENNKPLKEVINFNDLDKNIIVWGEISEIHEDIDIEILWYTPSNIKAFTLIIPIKKTTSTRHSRYFWGAMKFELTYFLNENPYGNWTISIPQLKTSCKFNIKKLNSNYNNSISQNENVSILDFRL